MKKIFLTVISLIAINLFANVQVKAATEPTQNVTIESFRTQAQSVDTDGKTEKGPFSKAMIEIYYYNLNEEKCPLKTMETDVAGYIRNVSLELPSSIHRNQLFF